MAPRSRKTGPDEPGLSIGALSRATGVPIETLRTWESRYGFPVPKRRPSGHRVYPLSAVARLRRIAEALALGHRAGQVVGASEGALAELVRSTLPAPAAPPPLLPDDGAGNKELLRLVETFDAEGLTRLLLLDWSRRGPLAFLELGIAPLLRAVGDAWEAERLEIRHEHFLSERVGDVLRSLRLPFEERATGPLVVFGSLPGESHALGLQMSALMLASVGCRILYLGTEVPISETADLARDLGALAVAISVSSATTGSASREGLRRLRRSLPRRVELLVGGEGAPASLPRAQVIRDLRSLQSWGQRKVQAGH